MNIFSKKNYAVIDDIEYELVKRRVDKSKNDLTFNQLIVGKIYYLTSWSVYNHVGVPVITTDRKFSRSISGTTKFPVKFMGKYFLIDQLPHGYKNALIEDQSSREFLTVVISS